MSYGGELQMYYQFLKKIIGKILTEYLYLEQLSGSKKRYSLLSAYFYFVWDDLLIGNSRNQVIPA
jgi:hypothetical protein